MKLLLKQINPFLLTFCSLEDTVFLTVLRTARGRNHRTARETARLFSAGRPWTGQGARGSTCLKRGGKLQPQACTSPSSLSMCSRTCRYCSRRCSRRTDSAPSLRRDATPLLGRLQARRKENASGESAARQRSAQRPTFNTRHGQRPCRPPDTQPSRPTKPQIG